MAPILDNRIAPAPPLPPTKTAPPPQIVQVKASYVMTGKDWFATITLSAIAVLVCLIIYRVIVPSDAKVRDRAVSAALFGCQKAIKSTAQYGDAEMPPYAKNHGSGDEFYFAWPKGSFEFANGFGSREKMSASCIGAISTGEIKQLTVNSKDIL